MPTTQAINLIVERLGVMAILAVALIFTLKYLTSSLSKQIEECKGILIKLIDRFNVSDKTTKDYRDDIKKNWIHLKAQWTENGKTRITLYG